MQQLLLLLLLLLGGGTFAQVPTKGPTFTPTKAPTSFPTNVPTKAPTLFPTNVPTKAPTLFPTNVPTKTPTLVPTNVPTAVPTNVPTRTPTTAPTLTPTRTPTAAPTARPTLFPTIAPSTVRPTSNAPTQMPTIAPTMRPTLPTTQSPTVFVDNMYPDRCPSGTSLYMGRCYQYIATAMVWDDAAGICTALDPSDGTSRMVDIRTQRENDFVYNDMGCANNNALYPSALNVWLGANTVATGTMSPAFGPQVDDPPVPFPKYVCACNDPLNAQFDSTLCINVPPTISYAPSPTFTMWGKALVGTCTRTGVQPSNLCTGTSPPSTCCPTSSTICQRPPTPAPTYVPMMSLGRGSCWIGNSRSTLDTAGPMLLKTSVGVSTSTFFDSFEPSLLTTSPTALQSLYTKHFTIITNTNIRAPPNCAAMWSYNPGMWVVDYCSMLKPFVCVRDAKCKAGFFKSSSFAVPLGGVPTFGKCDLCPAGQYRRFEDFQNSCTNCDAGYYGTNSSVNRITSTCDFQCPQGSFCPAGSGAPQNCTKGFYGLPVPVNGPGYSSFALSCATCPEGYFCGTDGMPNGMVDKCSAGRCGFAGQSTKECSSACVAGNYCPAGSSCPGRPCGDGGSGVSFFSLGSAVYCAAGAVLPTPVPIGNYGIGSDVNSSSTYDICPNGFYCVNGMRIPCGVGNYSDSNFDVLERVACKPCSAGYYCPSSISPSLPGATSPTQTFCGSPTDPMAARFYCPAGTAAPILVTDGFMTIPVASSAWARESQQPCLSNKICSNGSTYDLTVWNPATCNAAGFGSTAVPENLASANTSFAFRADVFPSLAASYNVTYLLLSQSFANPASLVNTICAGGVTVNDGIFGIDSITGRLKVNRFSPNPVNKTMALQFEACPSVTAMDYGLTVRAIATLKAAPYSQSYIECYFTVSVSDVNDQPRFPNVTQNRYIPTESAENMAASVCRGVFATAGCPNDASGTEKDEVAAFDEDQFGNSTLNYTFVGTMTPAMNSLKINSCTGLISQKGFPLLEFNDPAIPFCCGGKYKYLNYTVHVNDDGEPRLSHETNVIVYIENRNHVPKFAVNSTYDVWIPESTSKNRYPAFTLTNPSIIPVTDVDVLDSVSLYLSVNDASAFEIFNFTKIRTTAVGASIIDFESSKRVYTITVEARDNGFPTLSSFLTLNIRVVNVNDPPIFDAGLTFYIAENSVIGTLLCKSSTPCLSDAVDRVTSTDPDVIFSLAVNDTTTYSLLTNAGGRFAINSFTGQLTVAINNALDYENVSFAVGAGTCRGFIVRVRASSDGKGVVTQAGLLTNQAETTDTDITVYLVNVNEPPFFTTSTLVPLRVVDTWPIGTSLFHVAIQATDPDNVNELYCSAPVTIQTLTFSLSLTSSGAWDGARFFTVGTDTSSVTPQARIVVSQGLNYYQAPVCTGGIRCYTLNIRVTDNGGPIQGFVEQIYTIEIINVNKAPLFTQGSYALTVPEVVSYAAYLSTTQATPLVPLLAIDADIGGNASLVYTLISSDSNKFELIAGSPDGFKIQKKANVTLDFEGFKITYTLRVQVTDTQGKSSFIGKGCSVGASLGCGVGAFCRSSQCYETCLSYTNVTNTLLPFEVPRDNLFFCRNMTNVFNYVMVPGSQIFRETATADLLITLNDLNDPPLVVADPLLASTINPSTNLPYASPDVLSNLNCIVTGSISYQSIQLRNQSAISSITVYDQDLPNPGPWSAPFVFAPVNNGVGMFAPGMFIMTSASLGRITFPQKLVATSFINMTYNGSISVTDAAGASSICAVIIRVLMQNTIPTLPADFTVPAVSEGAGLDTIVWASFGTTSDIDSDVLLSPPDVLRFTTSFNSFFNVNADNGTISLKQSINYEDLKVQGFVRSLLVRVIDRFDGSAVVQVTVPVTDVNEVPMWTVPSSGLDLTINEGVVAFTVIDSQFDSYVSDPDIYAVDWRWNTTNITISQGSGCDLATCPFEFVCSTVALNICAQKTLRYTGISALDYYARSSYAFTARLCDFAGLCNDLPIRVGVNYVPRVPQFIVNPDISVNEGSAGAQLLQFTTALLSYDPLGWALPPVVNITGGDTGKVFEVASGWLRVAPSKTLDYEAVQNYTLTVLVTNVFGLSASTTFRIGINNVNDVTVSSVTVFAGPNVASNALACDGTTSVVEFVGTNFGLIGGGLNTQVVATYRRSAGDGTTAVLYTSSSCSVIGGGNTVVRCNVQDGGAGVNMIWSVNVTVPATQILNNAVTGIASIISFPAPVLTDVVGSTGMITAGGLTLILKGSCLGRVSDNLAFGSTLTGESFVEMCQGWDTSCRMLTLCIANSTLGDQISCTKSPSGLGTVVSWRVRAALRQSSSLVLGSYLPPTITSFSTATLKTSGVVAPEGFIINGTNFGQLNTSPTYVRFFYRHPSTSALLATYAMYGCKVTIAYEQVTCTSTDSGVGSAMSLDLAFGGQVGTAPTLLAFETPVISQVVSDGSSSPTSGGKLITLVGTSFGPVCGVPGTSTLGGAQNCWSVTSSYSRGSLSILTGSPLVYNPVICAVISQAALVCTTVEGTGANHTWSVTIGGQSAFVSPTAGNTSYAAPVVGAYLGAGAKDANTEGNQLVNLIGGQFGPIGGAVVSAQYGNDLNPTEYTAASCVVSIAHLQMRCFTAPGAGDSLNWRVLVDSQVSRAQLSDYAPPTVSSFSPSAALRVDGQEIVTVNGANFGPPGSTSYLEYVSYGPSWYTSMYEITRKCVVSSHQQLRCTTVPGVGVNMVWTVRVRGQSSTSTAVTGFSPPVISAMSTSTAGTEGGAIVTLTGSAFGFCDPNAVVRVAFGSTLVNFKDVRYPSILTPIVFPGACNPGLPLARGVARLVSFVVPPMTAAGSVNVRIQVDSVAFFGGYALTSTSFPFAYAAPVVEEVFAEPGLLSGEIMVTITGSNFCASEACCQTYLDGTLSSHRVRVHDHNRVTILAENPGSVKIICPAGETSSLDFSTQNPYVFGIVRASDFARLSQITFQTDGLDTVYIFALYATASTTAKIGTTDATVLDYEPMLCGDSSQRWPDTKFIIDGIITPNQVCARILVQVPLGQGLLNGVVITSGSLKSRADDLRFEFLSYTKPSISSVGSAFALEHATSGSLSTLLTATGLNFGINGTIIFGLVSSYGTRSQIICEKSSPGYVWSHTSAGCYLPEGEGRTLQIRILAGGQISNAATGGSLTYQFPVITGLSVEGQPIGYAADTSGDQVLVLTGTNFGRFYNGTDPLTSPGSYPVVLLGPNNVPCSNVLTSIHVEVRCVVPAGEGARLRTTLSIAGSTAVVSPVTFSYGAPEVYFVTPNVGGTDGTDGRGNRQVLQIVGKNFGVDELLVRFGTVNGFLTIAQRSSRTGSDDMLYPGTNHTSIRVYLPSYFGANLNVTVTVARQANGFPYANFSYAKPIVQNATVNRATTFTSPPTISTSGRRRLTEDNILIHTEPWSSAGYDECRPLPVNITLRTGAGTSMAYRTQLDVALGGVYTRVYQWFTVPNHTEITAATCDPLRLIGQTTQTGLISDLGETAFHCMRVFQDSVTSSSGSDLPTQLYPTGGFGLYMISERKNLFMSLRSFTTIYDAFNKTELSRFEYVRSATLTNGPYAQILPLIPTSGCDEWELDALYQARIDAQFVSSGSVTLPRKCTTRAIGTISGVNFGSGSAALENSLRVYLVDINGIEYEASTPSSGGNHQVVCTPFDGCLHNNTMIKFQIPYGSGRGMRVRVVVGNQDSLSDPKYDYEGPTPKYLTPGTVSSGYGFMRATGSETFRVLGANLGYISSPLSVVLNGKPCRNPIWLSGWSDRIGNDSISCQSSEPNVVGIRNAFVCVGGQGMVVVPANVKSDIRGLLSGQSIQAWSTSTAPAASAVTVNAMGVAYCASGTYGRLNELCVPCPRGATCLSGFSLPVPEATYALISMQSSSDRAQLGACPRERIDPFFRVTYPELVQPDVCHQVVRCVPPESCAANGLCDPAYRYQFNKCSLTRSRNDSNNACQIYFDSNLNSYVGVDSDCSPNTAPGQVCDANHASECSKCQVRFTTGMTAYGQCECTMPPRCALCTLSTHYRLNNQCVACPDNPALVFSLFIIAGFSCIGLAYYMQKKKVNLAFLSIGVDYFQVLAVLSTTNVPWPAFLRNVFTIFTLFLASIDIAAPECLVPNLEFPTKFWLTELLPVIAAGFLGTIHMCYTAYKVYKLRRKAKWLSHASRLVGIFILIIYVLYLSLTKKALDVFNCNPLDPDDGYSYTTFSSLTCDGGGLCRCNDPGGLQQSLVPPAIVFLCLYSFGFPGMVGSILFANRDAIREDQYLRANLVGDIREANPRGYGTRKRFMLLYMYYKPQYSFWMLVILARKFFVAFSALMFRGNPAFQLAVILIVLFISFTLQVQNRPYMSPGEYSVVVKHLKDLSKRADDDPDRFMYYRELQRKVNDAIRITAEIMRKEKQLRHKMGAGFWDDAKLEAREHDRRSVTEKYFFDLNAVEAILLGALIIICLAGVMFESNQYQSRPDLAWQGNLVIILTSVVLFGSLFYYLLVFVNEFFPYTFARFCGRFFLKYQNDPFANEEEKAVDDRVVMDSNPLFSANGPVGDQSASLKKEIQASKEQLALAKRQNEELKRIKTELQSAATTGTTTANPLMMREFESASGFETAARGKILSRRKKEIAHC